YANMAGHVAKLLHGVPHVMTTHSLEPLRPWKAEQLGGGYELSRWVERTAVEAADAVIAVSAGMRADVLRCYPEVDPGKVHVIHNGIDTEEYHPDLAPDLIARQNLDPDRPIVLFVGRITRQKGLPHLLHAARAFDPEAQLVLCASAPDTPQIADEVSGLIDGLKADRSHVRWISEVLPRKELVQLISHAAVFVCPSVYEPMGIVNLEAMACETAVVATATGGIPEVVADGETGILVPIDQVDDGTGTPRDAEKFAGDIAQAVNSLLRDPGRAQAMGKAGRERAVSQFSWTEIAHRTHDLYASLAS
ncbi:MAG TPA: glycogen synthase, partial [Sporichthya sp.]|nr:glycogen synthase [Sporichthya sp.]